MYSDRSTGTDMSRWPRSVDVVILLWVVGGSIATGRTLSGTNADARALVIGAAALGTSSLVGGLALAARRGDERWLAGGLILSGVVTPTGFAIAMNAIPILLGMWLLVRRGRLARFRR